MALTNEDKRWIAEVIAEAQQDGIARSRPHADEILKLVQQPVAVVYPGPTRSRYSYAQLCDSKGVVQRLLRVRKSELRNLFLNAFHDDPGEIPETRAEVKFERLAMQPLNEKPAD